MAELQSIARGLTSEPAEVSSRLAAAMREARESLSADPSAQGLNVQGIDPHACK